MRERRVDSFGVRVRKCRLSHAFLAIGSAYIIFISFKSQRLLEIATVLSGVESFSGLDRSINSFNYGHLDQSLSVSVNPDSFHRKLEDSRSPLRYHEKGPTPLLFSQIQPFWYHVGRKSNGKLLRNVANLSEFDKLINEAWALGFKAWEEAVNYDPGRNLHQLAMLDENTESCPSSVSKTSADFGSDKEKLVFLPCGLAAGSSITLVGTPHEAHKEYIPQLARMRNGDGTVLVSQFMVELQGMRVVDGEDAPKTLHLNPRIRGDWSQKSIIEHNTCYRMQWGTAMRCDGSPFDDADDMVDGFRKCEKWVHGDTTDSKESKRTSWLRRFIGRAKKPAMTWPFPFVEGRLFILTIQCGVEGYHIFVGGRHITSFPYRTGFTLEDATGLAIKGDLDVHSVYATNLPLSHPGFSLDRLEMSEEWRSTLLQSPVDLFIGILSASNHFAERMAIRKTWMRPSHMKSYNVVGRFFVALNARKEVNAVLKKEAEYFGDIVILPFLDRYELVVLKTIAICEFGVRNIAAAYIMKCDDDTFVRVSAVLKNIRTSRKIPLYMGNLNLLHRPLRTGKWAVTYEEWPESVYPPYANGPGYVISQEIASFVVAQHANQSLRLFKMEDVSMGMWVEKFNASTAVQYSHSWKFCQYGCMENYYTAHYQSPRQMLCLWDKLVRGQPHCCNLR